MTRVKVKSSYESLGGYSDFVDRNRGLNELGELFREKTKDPSNSRGVVSKVVSIWSDGTRMTGTLWKPKGALGAPESSYPAILLCHGWGGIRDHLDVSKFYFWVQHNVCLMYAIIRVWTSLCTSWFCHANSRY